MPTRSTLTLMLLLGFTSCDNWSETRVVETKRRGDIVCRALNAYRARNGKFPNDLKDLQPQFLSDIPLPTVGKRGWTYETYQSGQSYNLSVGIRQESEPLLQTQSAERWSYDTK